MQMIAAPETPARDTFQVSGNNPFEGMTVANLSPAVAEEVGLSANELGVVATDIGKGPAQRFFKKGDVLALINKQEIKTVADLRAALSEGTNRWTIGIVRGGKQLVIRLR